MSSFAVKKSWVLSVILAVLVVTPSVLSIPAQLRYSRGHRARGNTQASLPLLQRDTPPKQMRKQLAGPPSEFNAMRLPATVAGGVSSDSALVGIRFSQYVERTSQSSSSVFEWQGTIPVDSSTYTQFTFFTRLLEFNVEFKLPGEDRFVHADEIVQSFAKGSSGKVQENEFGIGGAIAPSTTYYFQVPKRGTWGVRLSTDAASLAKVDADIEAERLAKGLKKRDVPQMYLMTFNESPHTVVSYVDDYAQLKSGKTVGIRAHIYDNAAPRTSADGVSVKDNIIPDLVRSANLALVLPDGTEREFQMRDDGLSADVEANDGIWGTTFDATEVGEYIAEVVVDGATPDGTNFYRTSVHLVPIVRSDVEIRAASAKESTDRSKVRLSLETNLNLGTAEAADAMDSSKSDVTHRAYAEVWGTNSAKELVPVAWVSSMTDLVNEDGTLAFDLELDAKWLKRAKAAAPLVLKNVRIQERYAWVPVATAAELQVTEVANAVTSAIGQVSLAGVGLGELEVPITREMRRGANPFKTGFARQYNAAKGFAVRNGAGTANAETGKGKLVLSHGYCSPENVWPVEEFSAGGGAVKFEDLNQNRPTDLFARMLMEFGNQYPSFSLAAHSHGGVAATHLHSNYWSNMESGEEPETAEVGAKGGRTVADGPGTRLLSTVGSPYQGVNTAGILAGIGGAIGMGCGTNQDLTMDGAKLWLSGIPEDSQKDVFFYRTQYKTGSLVNFCVLASNVVGLPNDGVIPDKPSVLPAGQNMGIKKGWCHSMGMKWPSQLTDKDRNNEINLNSRR